jgi:hypothetical protein
MVPHGKGACSCGSANGTDDANIMPTACWRGPTFATMNGSKDDNDDML